MSHLIVCSDARSPGEQQVKAGPLQCCFEGNGVPRRILNSPLALTRCQAVCSSWYPWRWVFEQGQSGARHWGFWLSGSLPCEYITTSRFPARAAAKQGPPCPTERKAANSEEGCLFLSLSLSLSLSISLYFLSQSLSFCLSSLSFFEPIPELDGCIKSSGCSCCHVFFVLFYMLLNLTKSFGASVFKKGYSFGIHSWSCGV